MSQMAPSELFEDVLTPEQAETIDLQPLVRASQEHARSIIIFDCGCVATADLFGWQAWVAFHHTLLCPGVLVHAGRTVEDAIDVATSPVGVEVISRGRPDSYAGG